MKEYSYFIKTGPKGVLQDFQRYKQLETEQRHQQEEELKALINKFSISCQSSVSTYTVDTQCLEY